MRFVLLKFGSISIWDVQPKVTEKDETNLISEHSGFLLALGLNGHLNNLARLSLHDYLIKVRVGTLPLATQCYHVMHTFVFVAPLL